MWDGKEIHESHASLRVPYHMTLINQHAFKLGTI